MTQTMHKNVSFEAHSKTAAFDMGLVLGL